MSKKWKRILQRELDKEADQLMELVNSDPKVRDAEAPQEMRDKLFARIDEKKAEGARLSEEEKELIRLGKVYKKKRKLNKVLVLVAAVVATMAIGVTSFGGPDRVLQEFQRMIGDREQNYRNSDDERMAEVEKVTEAEAYQQVEDEFGFYPVRLDYLPEGMEFEDIMIAEDAQCAYLSYGGKNEESIVYSIYPNYRTGSVGSDIEDAPVEEFDKEIEGITVHIKEYMVSENQTQRWVVEYEYQDVYYLLRLIALEEKECEQVVENLYFP